MACTSAAICVPTITAHGSITSPKAFVGLKSGGFVASPSSDFSSKTVSNGSRVNCMLVVDPVGNNKYETLSYLPPLTSEQISKNIEYMIAKGWIPCLEFDNIGTVYRKFGTTPGYYDGRYWTMWKLPLFGCKDPASVLREIEELKKAHPRAFIRVLGFDNKRQVQCIGFLVQKPAIA